MNLSKDKWEKSEIGFVADEINEKVLNPAYSGCQKFIRPEDLEIGDMYVKSFRSPEDAGSGKHCYAGDILFTRRSVSVSQFKRRSCIVKFDAICSDEITVIRQDTNKLYPEFLNLVLNTTHLWDFAIAQSVGSVSKRIKWEDLSKYTFSLPSLEEQKIIATLFQSIETAIEQIDEQEKNLKTLQNKLSNGLVSTTPVFGKLLSDNNCNLCTFEDITDCIEKHNKKPLESGITRFVGLEFIEADNFYLQGFGNIEKGTTFTKCFSKGDVLFGKRRAYLKKVAVADFNGICSGDILVFRANKAKMLPELLPYYVSSDAFIQHAVSTSAGSLSPRTKWKNLAVLEISIPDLKTQKKIAEVFQQLQNAIRQLQQQKITLKNLKQKLLSEILG